MIMKMEKRRKGPVHPPWTLEPLRMSPDHRSAQKGAGDNNLREALQSTGVVEQASMCLEAEWDNCPIPPNQV